MVNAISNYHKDEFVVRVVELWYNSRTLEECTWDKLLAGLKPAPSISTNGDAIMVGDNDTTKKEITVLCKKFQSLTYSLQEQLESNELSVVRKTVFFLPQPLEKVYSPFLGKKIRHITRCTSHFEMFFIVQKCWNFIDPELLEHIIEEHGDRDLKSAMKSYHEDLVEFRKSTTVHRLVRNWGHKYKPGDIPDEYKKYVGDCVAKLHLNPETCTLEKLESLRNDVALYIGCHPLSKSCAAMMHQCHIAASSVIVVWLVALETVDIVYVLSKPVLQLIDRYAIEFLCLDDYIIYPLEEVSTQYEIDVSYRIFTEFKCDSIPISVTYLSGWLYQICFMFNVPHTPHL